MTGVILSGGKSARMGMNKAFLEIEGKRLIDRTMLMFRDVFREVILVTNSPLDYLDQDCIIVSDIFKNKGALGGHIYWTFLCLIQSCLCFCLRYALHKQVVHRAYDQVRRQI
ncbi:MAG: NTP transferase domain-containing protein [Syntrophales bacterium LBB04]|nr:NTP transferase domain-containing protein [Syntrophales bacterium LBB04]